MPTHTGRSPRKFTGEFSREFSSFHFWKKTIHYLHSTSKACPCGSFGLLSRHVSETTVIRHFLTGSRSPDREGKKTMETAARIASTPLYQEGMNFWDQLSHLCKRRVAAINSVVNRDGLPREQQVEWVPDKGIHLTRAGYPSTTIKAHIEFHSWGPRISGVVTGHQSSDWRFAPEEFEFSLSKDLDGTVVAVFDEGLSLTPHACAAYLTQSFRRCFPHLALPCDFCD